MKAEMLWLLRDFVGKDKVLFSIPVYQRNYDWDVKNCRRMLDDLKHVIECGCKHFMGSMVVMGDSDGFMLNEYIVIDGQQRLTTLMLMLKALYDIANEKHDYNVAHEIEERYLFNRYCEERHKIKLKPVKSDMEQYKALLMGHPDLLDATTGICRHYRLFVVEFSKWILAGISAADILQAMCKLQVVGIFLKQGEDDPQLIFESINSTGLELSSSDLIRNFLLMNAQDQDDLYEHYWQPIERALHRPSDYSDMDQFFIQFVQFRMGSFVNSKRLYESFVSFFRKNYSDKETCMKELLHYAEIFRHFVHPETAQGTAREVYESLKVLRQTTCYPFLFQLNDDLRSGVVSQEDFDKTLLLLRSYLVRRIVCGVPSNTLRALFLSLHQRVFRVEENKRKYYASINKFLHTRTSQDKFPSDDEFLRCLTTTAIYRRGAICPYLLESIENGGKERLTSQSLSVEHIMPQNPGNAWTHISAEAHEQYVHLLGNLSLTGYNAELSNKSFEEKKAYLLENSKAARLNVDIVDKTVWDIPAIEARGERLAHLLVDIFAVEKVTDPEIEFEQTEIVYLDTPERVTYRKPLSFTLLGRQYAHTTYSSMPQRVLEILEPRRPGLLERLAEAADVQSPYYGQYGLLARRIGIGTTPDRMQYPTQMSEGLYLDLHGSGKFQLKRIAACLQAFEIPITEFFVTLKADPSDLELPSTSDDDSDEE